MTFEQNLQINEHFEKIINQIDIKTEALIDDLERKRKIAPENDNASNRDIYCERDDLNKKRQRLIETIKEVETKNLYLIKSEEKNKLYEDKNYEKIVFFWKTSQIMIVATSLL